MFQLSQISDQVVSSPEMSPSKSSKYSRTGSDATVLPTALERTLKIRIGRSQLGESSTCQKVDSHLYGENLHFVHPYK